MDELRCKSGDLCMSDAAPFQQHWECRTTWPLADVIHDKYFLPMRNQLRSGDSITLCRYDAADPSHQKLKLLEVANVRVLSAGMSAETVPLAVIGGIEDFSAESTEQDQKPKNELAVAKGFAGKWRVVRGDTLIEEFGSKAEAEAALAQRIAA